MKNQFITYNFDTPMGQLILGWREESLCLCDWANSPRIERHIRRAAPDDFTPLFVLTQLEEYFAGQRQKFNFMAGIVGTPFQSEVWRALYEIPYGETRTYQEIANEIGRPTAVRAVANAVADNPISIIIPCHRVVGSDGSLTGYAGGIEAKRRLLEMEQRVAKSQ